MKNSFILTVTTLIFFVSVSFSQDKPIKLKFNLATGESYDYAMNMDIETKGTVSGQDIDVTNAITIGYHFKVTGDSAGWKKMESTISKIAMAINTSGVNINYDSDKPVDTSDAVNSTIGKILGSLNGSQFKFTMNENGDIGSVTGIDEMMTKMLASAPEAGPMASGVSSAFNEDNFKQNLKQAFGNYPGKPVKPGDSWTNTTNTSNSGMEMQMDNVYTLESVTGNIANIKVDSKISGQENTTGTVTGTMKYDIPSGVAVDGDLTTNMNMNITAGDQTIPMTIDIKSKITGKKS